VVVSGSLCPRSRCITSQVAGAARILSPDNGAGDCDPSRRHGELAPLTVVPSTPVSAAGSLPRLGRSREQLLSIVRIGERMVAWGGETAWTVLGMSVQEFVWGW